MSPSTETSESRAFASELKFHVSAADAGALRQWARHNLAADPYGAGEAGDTYLTTSLYFDTPGFDVYRRNGSYKRSKYRVRRYCGGGIVFLERKMKTRSLVSKRRSTIDIRELPRIGEPSAEKHWPGYWFHRRLLARDLRALCQVSYERTARVAMTGNGPIRLTLDEDLRALPVDAVEFQSGAGVPLNPGSCILELKFRYAMPVVFKHLLAEFGLNPQPISKYRLAVQSLGYAAGPDVERRERMAVLA